MHPDLIKLFERSSSVTIITGGREKGKTNLALRFIEECYERKLVQKAATNIKTFDKRVERIIYYDDFERWGQTEGRKIFVLDELAKHLNRVRFMTELSKLILDAMTLAAHYDCHFICCTVTEALVDKVLLETELLDCWIKKKSKKVATVKNYLSKKVYMIKKIPRTTIRYNRRDIAPFMKTNPRKKIQEIDSLPQCCKAALLYLKLRSYRKVAREMGCSFQNVQQLLDRHLKHADINQVVFATSKEKHA